MEDLATEVSNRLKSVAMKGQTLTVKLMVRRPDAPLETAKFLGMELVMIILWVFYMDVLN